MSKVVVGIDPGQKGGLVTLDGTGTIVDMRPMPADPREVATFLRLTREACGLSRWPLHVMLEKAQSMPKQGIASAFTYGTHYGELRGILVALELEHTLVPPSAWTKAMHVGTRAGEAKVRSMEAARRLKPTEPFKMASSKATKPHDGLVDAYLIAEFGRRKLSGGA